MIRLSKITDYGILILAEFVRSRNLAEEAEPKAKTSRNARELAERVELPLPMVSKVLKALTRAGVLVSQRGAQGGYALAHQPENLTVADIIAALEGPVALTECSAGPSLCDHEENCTVRSPLLVINHVIQNALSGITLSDLLNPVFTSQLSPLSRLAEPWLNPETELTIQNTPDKKEFDAVGNEN
ncbi:MAG: SUF system Fe-S cluster assembly regulator [Myxococcota bacterium]|nr:SUF system Fe-S cluster assembly regulator [Myxococcota bacterium]